MAGLWQMGVQALSFREKTVGGSRLARSDGRGWRLKCWIGFGS
jgi:hypothetical protein